MSYEFKHRDFKTIHHSELCKTYYDTWRQFSLLFQKYALDLHLDPVIKIYALLQDGNYAYYDVINIRLYYSIYMYDSLTE